MADPFDLPGLDDYLDDQKARMHVCPRCKHQCYFDPETRPTKPGQVYSQAGLSELSITGYCEHCFDEITEPPEEDHEYWSDGVPIGDEPDNSHEQIEDSYNHQVMDEQRLSED